MIDAQGQGDSQPVVKDDRFQGAVVPLHLVEAVVEKHRLSPREAHLLVEHALRNGAVVVQSNGAVSGLAPLN